MISLDNIKGKFKAILLLDNHPGHISAGFAVGVFISFTPPVPGLHTAAAILLSFLLRLNKLTCITGAWVNSPLTIIPSMILSYKLGKWLLGGQPTDLRIASLDWATLKEILMHHSKPLLLGSSILGFVAAVIAYFACYWVVVAFRRKDEALAELTREMEETGESLD